MRMRYDKKSDALYLRFDESKIVDSEEVQPGILLDFNSEKQVVGIELLDVTRRVPNADMNKLNFEVT